jgi:pimeloyl-ACP methyl ester carboxylesterase
MLTALKGSGWREAVEQMAANMPSSPATEGFVAEFSRSMRRTSQRVLVRTTEAALETAIWPHYPIDVPMLVIKAQSPFGPADPTTYAASVRTVAPLAQVHVWSDASHTLTAEHSARFNELVRAFVTRVTHATPSGGGSTVER